MVSGYLEANYDKVYRNQTTDGIRADFCHCAVFHRVQVPRAVAELCDETSIAQATRRDTARPEQLRHHDPLYRQRGELADHHEHSQGQEQEHSVRGFPRFQGPYLKLNIV